MLFRSVYLNGSQKALKEEKHWLVNGYANAWWIEKNNFQDDELVVEYYPQKLYYAGLIFSGLIILTLLILIIRQKKLLTN